MSRIKKQTDIELDALRLTDAARLLAFNLTKQRIADRANALQFSLPWEEGKNYSTWHRALDGQEVWVEIVQGLEALLDDQKRDPRKYLPGPPGDDLFQWMQEIAGATWWVQTLGLDVKANTLTAWMTRGGAKQEVLDDLRAKVEGWWARVDAACTQADLARLAHTFDEATDPRWNDVSKPSANTWDSYLYSYVHEDGHSVDEARTHFVEMCLLAGEHFVESINLSDPKLPCRCIASKDEVERSAVRYARAFDEFWSTGLPRAIPRKCPEGFDLTPYEEVGQWGDRRNEEGPKDVNVALYRLYYKRRVTPFWDEQKRCRSSEVEIIAVSEDGENWRPPNDQEKKGWDFQGLAIARYRAERGESPLNCYTREVEEAELLVRKARGDLLDRMMRAEFTVEELEGKVRAAEAALERARNDY